MCRSKPGVWTSVAVSRTVCSIVEGSAPEASASATAPATTGEAMDVPLTATRPVGSHGPRTPTPGAATSTKSFQVVNGAGESSRSVAPTEMTEVFEAGYSTGFSPAPLLPAAATTTTPRALA